MLQEETMTFNKYETTGNETATDISEKTYVTL